MNTRASMTAMLLACCLTGTGATVHGAQELREEDTVVTEGVGVAGLVVGTSTIEDARKRFGSPAETLDHNGYSLEALYPALGLSLYSKPEDAAKTIFAIVLRAPFRAVTKSGIALGRATLHDVKEVYGAAFPNVGSNDGRHVYEYPGIGFGFLVPRKGLDSGWASPDAIVQEIHVQAIPPAPRVPVRSVVAVPVSTGPLLFLADYEERNGRRTERHFVVDPGPEAEPRLFLTDEKSLVPVHRFSREEFLFANGITRSGNLLLVNLAEGLATPLLEGALDELVAIKGDTVYFLEQEHPDRGFIPLRGATTLGKAHSGHTRHRLFAFDRSGDPVPRLVTDQPVLAVLGFVGQTFWVLVDAKTPEIWQVAADGSWGRMVAAFEDTKGLRIDFGVSPGGTRFALSVPQFELWLRDLVVIDTATGKVLRRHENIDVSESDFRTLSPGLKFVWLDERTVRFSESADGSFRWVDMDALTGQRLRTTRYGSVGYEHVMPSRTSLVPPVGRDRVESGAFIVEAHTRLYFRGDAKPAVDLNDDQRTSVDLEVSPTGDWAAASGPTMGTVLLDGARKQRRKIWSWSATVTWMPPTGSATASRSRTP